MFPPLGQKEDLLPCNLFLVNLKIERHYIIFGLNIHYLTKFLQKTYLFLNFPA
ncbi:hypothetical protein NIES4073_69130 [Kalymmatonema gypsitolerans NIES-4073]|nr:hypothetical protein NIES4073_69130 [Scytonema sp. NIES-4073]